MKKTKYLSLLLAAVTVFTGGCGMNNGEVSYETSVREEISEEESKASSAEISVISEEISFEESSDTEEPQPDQPYIRTDKKEYNSKDKITVYYKNTDKLDWVGIYPGTAEPGTMSSLVWQYSVGEGELTFYASSLKEAGEYGIFLCDNDGYDVLYCVKIVILGDDTTDYGVKKTDFYSEKTNGVGKGYVDITPSSGKELTYIVNWSKNEKILEDYMPIIERKHSGSELFRLDFNDCVYMPDEADGICVSVKEGVSTPYYVQADDKLKLASSTLQYKFSVLTDLHITPERSAHITHLKAALGEIIEFAPDSIGIFTVGDNTNGGTKEDYELLLKIVDEEMNGSDIPIYYGLGNHELIFNGTYESQLELFKKYTGMPGAYFSVEKEGTKFIFLGSDEQVGEGVMHAEQIEFLENELESVGKEKPVYLFMHQPLIETVSGSFYSKNPEVQYWYGFTGANSRIRKILKEYPNAILFTGHTHWTFESEGPVLYGGGNDASFVNCASVGYLWTDDDVSTGGSEGYYIEVYEDYILIRGREFVSKKWCASTQLAFPLK